MTHSHNNRLWILTGLGSALVIAVFLSPFASSDPDGLDRVSQDLKFDHNAIEQPLSHQLPFRHFFEEYAAKGVPAAIATPLAGLVGTLATFGLAWGIGKLVIPSDPKAPPETVPDSPPDSEHS